VRVLHVDSARGWRGGQNQVVLTAKGMARQGHDVLVAARTGGTLAGRARAAGLEVRELLFTGDFAPAAMLGLWRLVRAFRPHVVHAHDPHATAAALAVPAPTPLVASRRVDFPFRGRWSRRKYGRCARVIAVSRAVADVLRADGLGSDRVRVVYEGVPDRTARTDGTDALHMLGIAAGTPVVGNVAALTAHKDHATLLEAAARVRTEIPEARFVIAGRGELESALRERARRLGLSDTVVFAGFRDDIDLLFPAMDVFCLSSRMEGLGTSLLDAMCHGRAVVATAAGGIAEAVQDGVTGRLVPPGDPGALARALLEMLRDRGRREAMGAAGRRRFLETFTDERMVAGTLGVYGEVA